MIDRIEFIGRLEEMSSRLINGCRNHGCCIKSPNGMATNGKCRCFPYEIRRELNDLIEVLKGQYTWNIKEE